MLLYQGGIAFKYFTRKPAPLKVMKEAVEKFNFCSPSP
ncbi:MAG: hypothetical protein N2Z79_03830 [Candidatus Omnitrophica bacterium]|nr:hypothetical protein [Candidatus Omnitrophota bacterium]